MSFYVATPTPGELIAGGVVLGVLNIIAVSGRFASRAFNGHDLSIDDWLTVPALLGNIVIFAAVIWGSSDSVRALGWPTPRPPLGESPLDFGSEPIQATKKAVWIVDIVQCVALACTKLSLIFFYRRIFLVNKRSTFHWITVSLITFTIAWGLAFFVAYIMICDNGPWTFWTTIMEVDLHCRESRKIEAAFAILDTASDVVIWSIPVILISRLQMSVTRKIGVIFVLGVGAVAVVASTVRLAIFIEALTALTKAYAHNGAEDSFVTGGVFWAMIESGLSLMACCLPLVWRPLFNMLRHWNPLTDKYLIRSRQTFNYTEPAYGRQHGLAESTVENSAPIGMPDWNRGRGLEVKPASSALPTTTEEII